MLPGRHGSADPGAPAVDDDDDEEEEDAPPLGRHGCVAAGRAVVGPTGRPSARTGLKKASMVGNVAGPTDA